MLLERLGRGRHWRVKHGYTAATGVFIPAGFQTDGASVPRALWWFASPTGELFEAAVVHDYLYSKAATKFDKKHADYMFHKELKLQNVHPFKARLAYWAVCLFGTPRYLR